LGERCAAIGATDDRAEAGRLLGELRAWLEGLPAAAAVGAIEGFLATGDDAALPFEFELGADGFLSTPPTLRVALLDWLGRLDPRAAAEFGRRILAAPTTADEWAIALRNVARGAAGAESAGYLRAKTEELIGNLAWQQQPSVGYLNAFDVLVHTRATASTPLLSGLIQRQDRRDLAHAAFLTLDRLTQREPVAVLTQLGQDRALQASRPEMVAQQFARADLRDPAQRELVRAWLLDPARSAPELAAFAGVFPNHNRMLSRNLLTTEQPVVGNDLRDHDRAVLALVSAWQQDPAFTFVRPHLTTMIHRLQEFTTPPTAAGAGGH
jgi:hypothetical protein